MFDSSIRLLISYSAFLGVFRNFSGTVAATVETVDRLQCDRLSASFDDLSLVQAYAYTGAVHVLDCRGLRRGRPVFEFVSEIRRRVSASRVEKTFEHHTLSLLRGEDVHGQS